jgi:hypothetical protein
MQQLTSAHSAPDLSETHARLTLALGTALGPLVAFLDDPLVVEIMLNADRACVVRKYGQAIGMPDFELLITLELGGQRPTPPERAPVDAPIVFPEPTDRSWGPDRVFMPLRGSLSRTGDLSGGDPVAKPWR